MKIGDKVVCVDDSACKCCCKGQPSGLKLNSVYVIAGFETVNKFGKLPLDKSLALILIGIKRPPTCLFTGFNSNRFRMLDELKADTAKAQMDKKGQTKVFSNEFAL